MLAAPVTAGDAAVAVRAALAERDPLAQALDVSHRTLVRWRTGDAPLPPWIGLSLSSAALWRSTVAAGGARAAWRRYAATG